MAAPHPAQGEGHVGVRGGGEQLEAVEPVGPVRLGLAFSDVLPDSSDPYLGGQVSPEIPA